MNSALSLILGVSVLAAAVGCGGGNSDATGGTGPIAVSGSSTGGASNSAGTSSTGGSVLPAGGTADVAGVPLTPTNGWVAVDSNTLGIQGAMFSYADDTSKMGLVEDFMGMNACIKGTAGKVDTKCTPPAGMDCYGVTWGAAIGLNLNQPIDPATTMGAMPMPYDASAIKGFTFEITGGSDGMTMVPTSLRFKVEDASGEYCTPPAKGVKLGVNTYMFADLVSKCWTTGGVSAEGAKTGLIKIAWQVVTNATGPIPFDYCVTNVRALQ